MFSDEPLRRLWHHFPVIITEVPFVRLRCGISSWGLIPLASRNFGLFKSDL